MIELLLLLNIGLLGWHILDHRRLIGELTKLEDRIEYLEARLGIGRRVKSDDRIGV